jgi:hypothetical protein
VARCKWHGGLGDVHVPMPDPAVWLWAQEAEVKDGATPAGRLSSLAGAPTAPTFCMRVWVSTIEQAGCAVARGSGAGSRGVGTPMMGKLNARLTRAGG